MTTTNDDWETLCAIYDDGEESCALDDSQANDERKLKLVSSPLPNGFCGTVFMTLSTSKIAFARLVRSDGSYRYFTLSKPPILKLDLLYYTSKNNSENDDDDELEAEFENEGPSHLRLTWHYYPSEWPTLDKEKYRSSLVRKCHSILHDEGSFSVCQFLEHDAISFYYETRETDASHDELEASVNTSNSWKTYSDPQHADYLLVILPPHMEQLYYSSPGILVHPREEAAKAKKLAAEKKMANKASATNSAGKKKKTPKEESIKIESTLDFGKHALLQNWKVRNDSESIDFCSLQVYCLLLILFLNKYNFARRTCTRLGVPFAWKNPCSSPMESSCPFASIIAVETASTCTSHSKSKTSNSIAPIRFCVPSIPASGSCPWGFANNS